MISYFIRFFSTIFLYFIFILFPFSSYEAPKQIFLRFFLSPENQLFTGYIPKQSEQSQGQEFFEKNGIPFVQPIGDENFSQYRIRRITPAGNQMSSFVVPAQKELHNGQENIHIGGSGFLTYPQDGSLFIWYPRLGNNVFFFDSEGKFLWNMQNSQYLQSFPSGRWILSVSGDQSRFQIRQPNLEPLLDVEGVLMNNFQMATEAMKGEDAKKQKEEMSACAGFLDGDIVFLYPAQKKSMRIESRRLLKSLWCDFEKKIFAVHMEEKKDGKPYDVLHVASIPNVAEKSENEKEFSAWNFSYPLNKYFPYKLPLAVSRNGKVTAFLLPAENDLAAQIFLLDTSSGKLAYQIPLHEERGAALPDDWRVQLMPQGFVFWNSYSLYVIAKDGLVFQRDFESIRALKVVGQNLYVDSPRGIFSYGMF